VVWEEGNKITGKLRGDEGARSDGREAGARYHFRSSVDTNLNLRGRFGVLVSVVAVAATVLVAQLF
jgi:hypothetical protein